MPDLALDTPGELYLGARLRQAIERRSPTFDVLLFVRQLQFPELNQAWRGISQRVVNGIADVRRMNAAVDLLLAKHVIDRLQDRGARAEGVGERNRIELQSRILEFSF